MSSPKLLLFSLLHFVVVIGLWFLALSVVLGLGFKSDWGVFDYSLTAFVAVSLFVLGLPSVLVSFLDIHLPTWLVPIIVSIQLVYGYLQVGFLSRLFNRRNNKINNIE
ncbi:hypothetical protein G5S52_22275 [Grimontia sp. S25]|uniref:Uncharacterized protein n=1 Tax=Grimontia sedimenti TaxID=2711294 RepID=A0A6M1RJ05_9GAMM|nr:hypothetical protein [Grimontia sedimenti]NGO00247.1 hypothetical protein [Grimontia sedimenti]